MFFRSTSLLPAISRGIKRRFQINFEFREPFLVSCCVDWEIICYVSITLSRTNQEDKRRCKKRNKKANLISLLCLRECFKKRSLTTLSVRSIASRYRSSNLYFLLHIKQCSSLGNTWHSRGACILFEAEAE